jgi:hypothetical protein
MVFQFQHSLFFAQYYLFFFNLFYWFEILLTLFELNFHSFFRLFCLIFAFMKIRLNGLIQKLMHPICCLEFEPNFEGSGFELRFAKALGNDFAQLVQ